MRLKRLSVKEPAAEVLRGYALQLGQALQAAG